MQKVLLGRTGLEVSVVCLGAGGHSRLGQRHGASADHSINVVRAALDLGIRRTGKGTTVVVLDLARRPAR